MSADIIHFPGGFQALGKPLSAQIIHTGIAEAGRIGIGREQVDALLAYDRTFTTYMLGLHGDADACTRRCGALGLRRLLDTMEREAG